MMFVLVIHTRVVRVSFEDTILADPDVPDVPTAPTTPEWQKRIRSRRYMGPGRHRSCTGPSAFYNKDLHHVD